MIRLVATDVDGTLIDHDGHLPDARRHAVRRLTDAGIPVVLATGKIWPSIRELWAELELTGPHITCNGAAVVGADGTIHHLSPLDDQVADAVAAELARLGVPHATYLEDGTIVTSRLAPELAVLPAIGEPTPRLGVRDGRRALKVLSVVGTADEGELRLLAADAARVQRTSHRFLEWNDPDTDKATGLQVVTELLGIAVEDVVAIGDAENDVPMLSAAGLGVAVAAAGPAAVAAADRQLCDDLAGYLEEIATMAVTAAT
jgi:5-amino-6-(5-phospho-D-ribitylamino)uracil phosphatase